MLTWGVVVADGVPRGEGQDGTSSTLDSGASDLGRALPDNLGEVTERVKIQSTGGVVSAVGLPVAHLVVVPLVSDTHGSRLDLEVVHSARSSPRSKVLAIAATALVPIPGSVLISRLCIQGQLTCHGRRRRCWQCSQRIRQECHPR